MCFNIWLNHPINNVLFSSLSIFFCVPVFHLFPHEKCSPVLSCLHPYINSHLYLYPDSYTDQGDGCGFEELDTISPSRVLMWKLSQATDTLVCSWTTRWICRLMCVKMGKGNSTSWVWAHSASGNNCCTMSSTQLWPELSSLLCGKHGTGHCPAGWKPFPSTPWAGSEQKEPLRWKADHFKVQIIAQQEIFSTC